MIGASQYIGIAILVLAVIWWFLFVNPISPVRKYWWSASDKLAIMIVQEAGYRAKVNSEYISVWVDLGSRSGIMVDKIVLKIGHKRVTLDNWKPHDVMAREHKFQDFKRPDWLDMGKHESQLIAYTPEGYSKSRKFILEITG